MLLPKIADIVFPRYCVGCGTEGSLLCPPCWQKIHHSRPAKWPTYKELGTLTALGAFKGSLREAIHSLKFSSVKTLAEPIARELATLCREKRMPKGIIIPIPLSRARARIRGYNQSALVAKKLAFLLGWYYLEALERQRHTLSQADLKRTERLKNVQGAFICRYNFSKNRLPLYLLDDVITTGATLHSATQALKQSGACKVRPIAIACD
jgi:ComF family protein